MAHHGSSAKSDLVAEIEAAWTALNSCVARVSEVQITTLTDQGGWTVKDHLTHIAAWEDSVVSFLQGRPRYEGLGVAEAVFSNTSFDDINAVIQQQRKELSIDAARGQFEGAHRRLMGLLQALTDADLHQPSRHFVPSSPAEDRRLAIDIIRENTSVHFLEHLAWIDALIASESEPE